MTRYLAILTCVTALFLSACGQKGPLYLPEPKQTPTESSSRE
ncbi:LPS translocon maturation chaperone LptM [Legionella worsleiensis]|nr:lipoprotein [Legionella worsleiensis]